MKILLHPSADSGLMLFSRMCAALLLLVGCTALAGWVFDLHTLRVSIAFLTPFNAETAIALILAGISLLCSNPDTPYPLINRIGMVFSGGLVLLGVVTLLEYALGMETSITQILSAGRSPEISSTEAVPMEPAAAVNFILSGAALFIQTGTFRKETLAQSFALGSVCLSGITLIGHLYGVFTFDHLGPYVSVTLLPALATLVLALGILCSDPSGGIMQTLSSGALGGVMLRRILPFAVLVPILLGWLRLQGERAGFYGPELGVALFAISNVMILAILLWRNASYINGVDIERKQAVLDFRDKQDRYRILFESIPLPMWVYDIKSLAFLEINDAAIRQYGYTREEFLSMKILDIRPEEETSAAVTGSPSGASPAGISKHRKKDGSIIEVEVTSRDFNFGATPARIVLAARITRE